MGAVTKRRVQTSTERDLRERVSPSAPASAFEGGDTPTTDGIPKVEIDPEISVPVESELWPVFVKADLKALHARIHRIVNVASEAHAIGVLLSARVEALEEQRIECKPAHELRDEFASHKAHMVGDKGNNGVVSELRASVARSHRAATWVIGAALAAIGATFALAFYFGVSVGEVRTRLKHLEQQRPSTANGATP